MASLNEAPNANGAPVSEATAAEAPAKAERKMCSNGCGKPAGSLECPKCKALGRGPSFFCSQLCFASKCKKMHAPAPKPEIKYDFPPGTYDGMEEHKKKKGSGGFAYTGKLRSVMPVEPVPKREVPDHIVKPDYATEVRGNSFSENVARVHERQGRILDAEQIEAMRKVSKYGREILDLAAAALRPGVTTLEIDALVHEECIKRECYPSPLGYHLFPRSVCTSINECICHGIPDARPLEDGDIINLDVTVYHGGFHSDLNATYPVGTSVPQQHLDLIACARECLDEAIRMCKPGVPYQDVGKRIEEVCTQRGFSTNKTFVGHGVNQLFHPLPDVPHYAGNRAAGVMRPGQTFTIEPMICIGDAREVHWPDNWTAVTRDGKASAQFEETLLITETGVEVLTAAPGWVLPAKKAADGSVGASAPTAGAGAEKAADGERAPGEGAAKKKKKKAKK
ncbi:hypothetical protein Rhopal_001296-T1 [Rhodotorula paludigena]|uniref:Methionine aminopeptidase n=1 Tax=Rhodotorula paludigena TaxID=86838 RepID=A0AAV5GFC1_9BASI|nr:hypothetical protein Rhopal_001296-T1 [Rhodotorula paludigena]